MLNYYSIEVMQLTIVSGETGFLIQNLCTREARVLANPGFSSAHTNVYISPFDDGSALRTVTIQVLSYSFSRISNKRGLNMV